MGEDDDDDFIGDRTMDSARRSTHKRRAKPQAVARNEDKHNTCDKACCIIF
jgi:hypothetical protein